MALHMLGILGADQLLWCRFSRFPHLRGPNTSPQSYTTVPVLVQIEEVAAPDPTAITTGIQTRHKTVKGKQRDLAAALLNDSALVHI